MKKLAGLLIAVLLAIFLAHCGSKEEVVARIGKVEITKSQFVKEMTRYHGDKPNYQSVDVERKKTILNTMIKRKLKLLEAYDTDLDKSDEMEGAIASYRKRLIANKYYEKAIVDQLVSQKEIDAYLQRQGVEMRTTQILIGSKDTNPEIKRSQQEARALAEQVVQQAKNGANFTDLALKYSDEPNVKNTKGGTKFFRWGERLEPYQEATWKLKNGEISDPVETRYGYFIIRMDERREVPDYKPDKSTDSIMRIKRSLFQAKGDSGSIVANKHLAGLREKYGVVLDTVAIKEMAALLTDKIKSEVISPETFTPQQQKIVLAKWKGGKLTWKSILDQYNDRLNRIIGRFRQASLLQNEVENISNLELVVQDADAYDIEDDQEIEKQINAFLEDRLVQLVEKKEVDDKVTVSDDEVLAYYQRSPNQFSRNEEIELWQIYVKDEKLAKTIAAKVRAGGDFATLAKKYSQDKSSAPNGGYVGFRAANAMGPVSTEAFRLGPNKIGGPVKTQIGWSVFKTGKKNPKTLRPFKEVENMARTQIRTDKTKVMRKEWEQNLETKFKPVIYEEILKQV